MLKENQIKHLCIINALSELNKTGEYVITFKVNNNIYTLETKNTDLNKIEKELLYYLDINHIKYKLPIHITKIEPHNIYRIKLL